MKLPPKSGQRLAGPAIVGIALVAAGAAAVGVTGQLLKTARAEQQTAAAERAAEQNKFARASDEEREIREKLVDYRKLLDRGVVGEERRFDWVDRIGEIKTKHKLLEIKYSIEPQRAVDYPGIAGPGEVEFRASSMKLDMALLHEEDLFRFLDDLRHALSAYVVVKSCMMERSERPSAERGLAPRLRAACDLDLVTIRDKKAGGA